MQVLAMALGGPGSVIPNPKGWEIGVYEVDLTEEGRDWFERVEGDRKVDEGSEKVVEKVVGTKRIVSEYILLET
jgi:GMP synthase-like glutamine amidotransferase